MLERCTRPYGATRLYARVSSSHVWSGLASINGLSTAQATGDTQPPPLASGSTVPVSRCRCTQRWTLSAGQLIDIVKWNLLCHIPVKMRGAEDDEEETTKSFTSV